MKADQDASLATIQNQHPGGIISQLLKIQKYYRLEEAKSLEWADNLECLRRLRRSQKRRREEPGINPTEVARTLSRRRTFGSRNYVAVSYPWKASAGESSVAGGWQIRACDSQTGYGRNEVRDVVLKRVTTYAEAHDFEMIWIDIECVPQDDSPEHEAAMQSMDLVYRYSDHPVALLSTPLESQEDVDDFYKFLCGEFVDYDGEAYPQLKDDVDVEAASNMLRILQRITSDQWWSRAWIFQENYSAGGRMRLLIPHTGSIKARRTQHIFGRLPGELDVKSADFQTQSTLFCLACRQSPGIAEADREICKDMLLKAGKYTILHKHADEEHGGGMFSTAMSTRIFEDLGNRAITFPSDFLPIAANCCIYDVRLDSTALRSTNCSLSICILALYLLNGEIFKNEPREGPEEDSLREMNVLRYLKAVTLDNFIPPVGGHQLTFLKSCRFVDVELSRRGIKTSGWLWSLAVEIPTTAERFNRVLDREIGDCEPLDATDGELLHQLADELHHRGQARRARILRKFIREDFGPCKKASSEGPKFPSRQYKKFMARKVAQAIRRKKPLVLGNIFCDEEERSPSFGIFVIEEEDGGEDDGADGDEEEEEEETNAEDQDQEQQSYQSYAFTAWSWRGNDPDIAVEESRLDKFVSLEVDIDEVVDTGDGEGLPPLVRTKRWLNGLCFFDKSSKVDVTFAWPPGLE